MHFLRNTSRAIFYSYFPLHSNQRHIPSYQSLTKLTRSVTTFNDHGQSKKRPPNKEERLAANEAKKRSEAYNRLLTAFGNHTVLTPDQWRDFQQKPSTSSLLYTLDTLKMLKPPKDALETAKNFLTAFSIESNMVIDKHFLELYAKRYSEKGLTKEDENEVLKM